MAAERAPLLLPSCMEAWGVGKHDEPGDDGLRWSISRRASHAHGRRAVGRTRCVVERGSLKGECPMVTLSHVTWKFWIDDA